MNPRESLMKTPGRLRKKQKGCRTMAAALLGSGITNYALTIWGINVP